MRIMVNLDDYPALEIFQSLLRAALSLVKSR